MCNKVHVLPMSVSTNSLYYMASSVSEQDESNPAAVIGYLSGLDGAILPARDYLPCPARKM